MYPNVGAQTNMPQVAIKIACHRRGSRHTWNNSLFKEYISCTRKKGTLKENK